MRRASTRVERRSDGWYEPERGIVLPLIADVYEQGTLGGGGLVTVLRELQRRLAELERRG
mgnify:FL=1